MCWPSLEGCIEVEERYRKHKDGPRRKRLHFVKDRSSGHSDEWPRPHRDMHQQLPPHPPYDPRWLDAQRHAQYMAQMHGQIPIPPHHHAQPQMGFHGHQGHLDQHAHHNPGDETVRVEEGEHHHYKLPPRVIEAQPRASVPSHLRPGSRSRGRGHSRHGSGSNSLFSGSSYSDSHHGGRGRRRSLYSDDDSFRDLKLEPKRITVWRVPTTRRIR